MYYKEIEFFNNIQQRTVSEIEGKENIDYFTEMACLVEDDEIKDILIEHIFNLFILKRIHTETFLHFFITLQPLNLEINEKLFSILSIKNTNNPKIYELILILALRVVETGYDITQNSTYFFNLFIKFNPISNTVKLLKYFDIGLALNVVENFSNKKIINDNIIHILDELIENGLNLSSFIENLQIQIIQNSFTIWPMILKFVNFKEDFILVLQKTVLDEIFLVYEDLRSYERECIIQIFNKKTFSQDEFFSWLLVLTKFLTESLDEVTENEFKYLIQHLLQNFDIIETIKNDASTAIFHFMDLIKDLIKKFEYLLSFDDFDMDDEVTKLKSLIS